MTAIRPVPRADERDLSDGLRPHERIVLDLYDAGLGLAVIAERAAMPIARVRKIVEYFSDGFDAEQRWSRAAELANRAYLRAVAATGGSFA